MKIKHPIIALPTDKASQLAILNGILSFERKHTTQFIKSDVCQPQFLYILSDEPIKEGDWKLVNTSIDKCKKEWILTNKSGFVGEQKKIIATNNPDLLFNKNVIASIPISRIEHYAKHQPKEIKIEMNPTGLVGSIDANKWKPKLTLLGEIMWSPVEEKETEFLPIQRQEESWDEIFDKIPRGYSTWSRVSEWLKENYNSPKKK